MRRPPHRRTIALTAAALLLAVGATPAVLAAIPRLDVFPAEQCVLGHWAEGTSVTFQLRTASGTLKDQQTDVASEEGVAFGCFDDPIVAGDRIRVKQGSSSRTITALKLKLGVVDRASDQVRGKAAAGRTVRLRVDRCTLGQGFNANGCADALSVQRTVSSGGGYAFDTTGALDLRGRDLVEVIMKNATGDRFRRDAIVPVYFLTLDSPSVGGVFPPGPPIEFELFETPGGAQKATAALPSPVRRDDFHDGTSEVPVRAGDQVTGAFSIDAKMVIPAMVIEVDATHDVVTARCFPGRAYDLVVHGVTGVTGKADSTGLIVRDFGAAGFDIPSDHTGVLECLAPTGDSIEHHFHD